MLFLELKLEQSEQEELLFQRIVFIVSWYSYCSKQVIVVVSDDVVSFVINKLVEEDVCFLFQDEWSGVILYIDFDYLENFMKVESEVCEVVCCFFVFCIFFDVWFFINLFNVLMFMIILDGDFLLLVFDVESY